MSLKVENSTGVRGSRNTFEKWEQGGYFRGS